MCDVTGLLPTELVFRLPWDDPDIVGVRLWQTLGLPAHLTTFARSDGQGEAGWTLRVPRVHLADLERLEYQYVVQRSWDQPDRPHDSQLDHAQPQDAEPQDGQPQDAQPQDARADVAQLDVAQPDGAQPDGIQRDGTQPDEAEDAHTRPRDTAGPDSSGLEREPAEEAGAPEPEHRPEHLGRPEHPGRQVHEDFVLDPTNPRTTPGPFGSQSVIEFPGYRAPAWLSAGGPDGRYREIVVPDTGVGELTAVLWTPTDDDAEPLPMLAVHDGPEMAEYARIIDYVRAMTAHGALPPSRVALLAPGPRNQRYSADPGYARALTEQLMPRITGQVHTPRPPVLLGASLGGLAALHAEWTCPGTFAAVVAQSGSFFTRHTDPQESGFEYFDRITAFTASVQDATSAPTTAPVLLTCGLREENYACNTLISRALGRLGLGGTLIGQRDLHTWTCWRDTFHPYLTEFLAQQWSPATGEAAAPVQDGPGPHAPTAGPSIRQGRDQTRNAGAKESRATRPAGTGR
ncbi:MAG: alpha/beta hydrolase [Actinomycetales bacterium]